MALKPARLQWPEEGTPQSADFDDIYFQRGRGLEESHYVFLEKNRLPGRFAALRESGGGRFRICELGFGTGLNFLLTARLWQASGAAGDLLYAGIEKHPLAQDDLRRVLSFWPELQSYAAPLLAQYPPPLEGFYHLHFPALRARLMLCLGDVADVLPEIAGKFDAWYLDGFAPAKNPAMWDEKLFPLVAARTRGGGTLSTFSAAGAVRRGLGKAGFTVEKVTGFGAKRDMTVARMEGAAETAGAKSVTVIGAGLAGASAAYAAAQKGCDVTVIERRRDCAMETSGNPAGVLYPKLTADRSPMGAFFHGGFFFTRHLAIALGLPSWQPSGLFQQDIDEEMSAWHEKLAASGYWPEEFMRRTDKGMRFPLGGFLSPPELCRRLLDHPKIRVVYGRAVASLDDIDGDALVIAASCGTQNFTETKWLPIVPVRGQMTFLRATAQSKNLAEVLCHDGSLTPAADGLHAAGATFQREDFAAPEERAADDAENLAKLNGYFPQYGFTAEDIAGARAGYRAALPDHLPALGLCPDYAAFSRLLPSRLPGRGKAAEGKFHERLYLATGFGGQGLSGAPLGGEIVASLIDGDILPVPQSVMPYLAPERFILRDIKRGKI
ncbi:MAG: bifunctional tRNA (5-methylaminomethyl-2-thiouridine)(34)-methyltransferase MnmD/FAD-dependent 5-carboxymethylaminomethyl-2-thiouridine(34) oxidoreductase MnmC [Alphaproteobacteria bacterium]|nr:bifunctional tRNA (5-methylaminomethyl-2-thiouridine)(34)-methyltransferase MnmD/FAD-dependent 5-carboxymethylaminomethyl-2-thiouridine(34) oxidoreductase MnmC [Alphaproteobacteria bacterium]MDE2337329.1 bifunctional tRNA (5-methylaminomethyl-2-thiouridine)(34)-methyltransferase MnmD/FAD-dependent 5-carboxymethylaminomethyl-2-thiouridine(34) oxidoreductase MnmC [Alphaproteobacteria bacterium]